MSSTFLPVSYVRVTGAARIDLYAVYRIELN